MLTVEYSVQGIPNADLDSEKLAMSLYEDSLYHKDITYHTSTESLILAIRVLIAEKNLPHNDIVFKYGEEILKIDEIGQLGRSYPKGFCDAYENLLHRIVRVKIDKAKKNKEESN